MTKQFSILAAAVTAASLLSATAQASGFRLNDMSASGMGTAQAGRGALVEDASIVYYNPAGMSKLKQAELSLGAYYADIHGSLKDGKREIGGADVTAYHENSGDMFPASAVPFVYYARPLNEKVAIGLGLYVPYGTTSKYDANSINGSFARDTIVKTMGLQPSVSYKVTDTFAVGAGLDIVYITGTLSKDLSLVPGSPVYNNTWEVEGDDVSVGFNLGFMWDVTPATTLGLTYRSAIDFTLEGESRAMDEAGMSQLVDLAVSLGLYPEGTAYSREKSEVPLEGPQSLSFSFAHKLTDRLNLLGTATWVDWSSFEKLDVDGTAGGIFSSLSGLGNNKIGHVEENWKDTKTLSVGATYQLNEQWLLRTGYMYDETPVKNAQYRTARVPDNDRHWLNVGARYNASAKLSFDAAAAYLIMQDAHVDEINRNLDGSQKGDERFTGTYELDAFMVSFQMNYRM